MTARTLTPLRADAGLQAAVVSAVIARPPMPLQAAVVSAVIARADAGLQAAVGSAVIARPPTTLRADAPLGADAGLEADAPVPGDPDDGAVEAGAVLTTFAVVALALFVVPLIALIGAAPLERLPDLLSDPALVRATRLSALTSLTSLVLSVVLGVPLAWLFARQHFPGKSLLRAIAVLPMVLPPVVGGVALLLAFGRQGILGGPLEQLTGVTLPFTTAGAVLAATFVSMPFLVVTVEAGLRQADRRVEQAAATLGASRWTIYRRITLPQIAPSLAAGMALAWARALGEFGATITFAGNFEGRTQTMPLAVFQLLQSDPGGAYLLSLVLLVISVIVLVAMRGRYLGGDR